MNCPCKLIDTTPKFSREYIEGFIYVEVNKDCTIHAKYLDLPNIQSDRFSIEIFNILERKETK